MLKKKYSGASQVAEQCQPSYLFHIPEEFFSIPLILLVLWKNTIVNSIYYSNFLPYLDFS